MRRYSIILAVFAALVAAAPSFAGSVLPYTFTPNTKAYAASVNANFAVLDSAVADTRTGYLSISPAAFVPQTDGSNYSLDSGVLINIDSLSDYYSAGISLPHGVVVTAVTLYYDDGDASNNATVSLMRHNRTGSSQTMATAVSSGYPGFSNAQVTSISYATIDNANYTYGLNLTLPTLNTQLTGVRITYQYNLR